MEFTGERYVPSLKGVICYEHLHRYLSCLDLVKGKSVVDIACGEGYGSSLLANYANSVIGIDIDSECVEYATNKYKTEHLNFVKGSCTDMPIASRSIDVVISFETIEHHNQHKKMMAEIKRILKDNGCLIISSPNRPVYAKISHNHNPFHVRELDYEELNNLLSKFYKNIKFYGQKMIASSFMTPLYNSPNELKNLAFYSQSDVDYSKQDCVMIDPVYFIVQCSDQEIQENTGFSSIYFDAISDILKEMNEYTKEISKELNETSRELNEISKELKILRDSRFYQARNCWLELKASLGISKDRKLLFNNKHK